MNTSEVVGMSTGNLLKIHIVSPDLIFWIYFYLEKNQKCEFINTVLVQHSHVFARKRSARKKPICVNAKL